MNHNLLMRYLKEICDMSPKVITLSGGGEPLCRKKELLQMIQFIKKNYPDISGVLITNATLFDKYFANRLVESGWDDIIVSIQGPNPKINDFIMGRNGAFDKAVEGISIVNKLKHDLNKEKPSINLKTVLTKHNYKQILEMVQLANRLDIKSVEFRMVNEGEVKLGLRSSEISELKELIKKVKEYSQGYGMRINFEFEINNIIPYVYCAEKKEDNHMRLPCLIPSEEIVIFGNRAVSVCCNYFDGQFSRKAEGIIKNTKSSIKKIWLDGFKKMRGDMRSNKRYAVCHMCSYDMAHQNKILHDQ